MHYYFNDGTTAQSKVEALEYQQKTQLEPFLYYYDEVFSKINWTINPPHTLDFYYRAQAQRIRDEYDYVILCYSGGYDSTNILETFYYNNIKIDKIVTVGALSEDSNRGADDNHNGELYKNAFPTIEKLGLNNIFEVIDYTKYFDKLKNFSVSHYASSWVYETSSWYSPNNWFWKDVENYIVPSEFRDKKVAIIFGKDKPNLTYKYYNGNKIYGFSFNDAALGSYAADFRVKTNLERVNFYWDPNFPLIVIKQLHTVFERHAENTQVDNIVYNLKNPLTFKSPKSKSNIFSLRDRFLMKKQNSDIFKFWLDGVTQHKSTIMSMDNKPIMSKFYPIGIVPR
jgi:hypothetical protein